MSTPKPVAEIHLSVYEDDIKGTPMIITGSGQELATLLLIAFAESEQFFGVAKAAIDTFNNHGEQIKKLYSQA